MTSKETYKFVIGEIWLPLNIPIKSKGIFASVRTNPKIGRNAVCPCGSGLKSKKCHHS